MLTRDQILAAKEHDVETIEVPEWGGSVGMRRLTCREAEVFQDWLMGRHKNDADVPQMVDMRAMLLSMVLCDENGNLLFTESDIEALGEKSNDVMHRLFMKAKAANLILEDAINEAEKNSEAGR